ncbi:MAG: hypothetical protein ABSF53_19385 [Terracidiphilus sp.]
MQIFNRSHRIIVADSHARSRAGLAKTLAMDASMRIVAQCKDLDRMYRAIATFPGATVLFATSLQPDLPRLRILLDATGGRGVAIAESNETASTYLEQGFSSVFFRSDNGLMLVHCIHRAGAHKVLPTVPPLHHDSAGGGLPGTCNHVRLTSNEMRLMRSISIGLCTRMKMGVGEMAMPFGNH